MLNGPIVSGLVMFALPLLATNLLQLLFNTADIVVIGRFGSSNSLAAVGVASMVAGTFTSIITHFCIGGTVASGIALGEKDSVKLRKTVHGTMGFAFAGGMTLMLLMAFTMKPLLTLLNTPQEIYRDAFNYLCCFLPSIPACTIYNFGAALLRAKGDTQRPFFILTFSGIVNVLLNLVFVLVFKMGVVGVAIATTIAFYISMSMILRLLCNERDDFKLNLRKLTLHSPMQWLVIKVGLTNAFQGMMFHAANLVVQGAVNSFGAYAIAGNAASQTIGSYLWMSMNGFAQAGMSFTAQNTGAKNYRRIIDIFWRAIMLAGGIGLVEGIFCQIFGTSLLGIFTKDQNAIQAGLYRLHLICGFYFICGIMDTTSFIIRGMGCSVLPAAICLAGALGVRLLWIFTLFQIPRFHTLFWLYMTYPVSWTATLVALAVALYFLLRQKLEAKVKF